MPLVVNYSSALDRLLREGALDCDLIKCPEWENIITRAETLRPVHVHFEIALGSGRVNRLDLKLIERLLDSTATPHLNFHFSGLPGNPRDCSPEAQARLLKTWIEEICFLQQSFPGVPTAGENLPYMEHNPQYCLASTPNLISRALLETDSFLLLDLSHACISAKSLGVDYQSFVAQHPLDRLNELHITGIRQYGGGDCDHFDMGAEDWSAAEWASEQIRAHAWRTPALVAYEYGGIGRVFSWRCEEEALRRDVPRLMRLFGG